MAVLPRPLLEAAATAPGSSHIYPRRSVRPGLLSVRPAATRPWPGPSALPSSPGDRAALPPAASYSSLCLPACCSLQGLPHPCVHYSTFPSLTAPRLHFSPSFLAPLPPLSPPPRMRLSLLSPLLLLCLSRSRGSAELPAARAKCPTRCDVSKCPSPSCPSGYVPDRCNCCLICAAGEGDSCGRKEDPPCGDSLDCRYPMGKRFAKGVCQCKLSVQVCGSDGRTYDNICQLKAVSRKALQHGLPAVAQVQKGACESGRSMAGPGREQGGGKR